MATFKPNSYLRAEAALNQITEDVSAVTQRVDVALTSLANAEKALQDLASGAPVGWGDLVAYVNAQRQANPGDPQWVALKGRMDKIVGDFVEYRKFITRIRTAVNGVE